MARARLECPILSGAQLRKLAEPPSVVVALHEMDDQTEADHVPSIHAAIGARRCKIARAYSSAINALLVAAPEGGALGAPLPLIDLLVCLLAHLPDNLLPDRPSYQSVDLPTYPSTH